MTIFTDYTVRRTTVFGDWHGDAIFASTQIHNNADKADAYLHVGDFGFWSMNDRYITLVEEALSSIDKELWFVDGNHENHDLLEKLSKDERGLNIVTDHIRHIPRGFMWNWSDKIFAGLGGAVSIDRRNRKFGETWFLQEEISDEEYEFALNNNPELNVDVLLTHDAPFLSTNMSAIDPYIDMRSNRIRKMIADYIMDRHVKFNIHGHHHRAYVDNRTMSPATIIGLGDNNGAYSNNQVELMIDLL